VPSVVIVGVRFERRRALATGVAVCGTGVGTVALAPLVEHLLRLYGWRGTLLIEAGLLLNCCVCAGLYRPTSADRATLNPPPPPSPPPPSPSLHDTVCHARTHTHT